MDQRPDDAEPPGLLDRLLIEGEDPDPRFTMANERTFLAWLRTGLALIALGLGVATFVATQERFAASVYAAAALVALGGVVSAASWFRWLRVERAVRRSEPIPRSTLGLFVAVAIAVLAASLLAVIVAGR